MCLGKWIPSPVPEVSPDKSTPVSIGHFPGYWSGMGTRPKLGLTGPRI